MFNSYRDRVRAAKALKNLDQTDNQEPKKEIQLSTTLKDNIDKLKEAYGQNGDLTIREFLIDDIKAAVLSLESMVNRDIIIDSIMLPVSRYTGKLDPVSTMRHISQNVLATTEQMECKTIEYVVTMLAAGFAVFMLDGSSIAIAAAAQGFNVRSISEPSGESVLRGSREGFNELVRNNMAMIRRRIQSDDLRFERMSFGGITNTAAYMCFLRSKVSDKMLNRIRRRLKAIDMESVLESGYIQPYLECKPLSLFSTVGYTERPDTVCGKLIEGRVALLVDGTPFALIVPHLFVESFQTVDDYTSRPYYAFFIRLLKYISFFITVFLPGLYVAVGTFHSEMLPDTLFYNIIKAEMTTPMTLVEEALIIHVVFEIVREAGLRLPKPIGQAVSIVGGLVLGDTAVSSGLIGAPMVIVVALAAITGFVIPELNQPVVIIRFIAIIAAGYMGIFGVVIVLALTLVNLCSLNSMGVPYLAPVSPFNKTFWQDVLFRLGWKKLSSRGETVERLG